MRSHGTGLRSEALLPSLNTQTAASKNINSMRTNLIVHAFKCTVLIFEEVIYCLASNIVLPVNTPAYMKSDLPI